MFIPSFWCFLVVFASSALVEKPSFGPSHELQQTVFFYTPPIFKSVKS